MKKLISIFTILFSSLIFIPSSHASIDYAYDGLHDTVTYNSNKKIVGWSTATLIDFYKTLNRDNNSAYHVTAFFNGVRFEKKFARNALLLVDNEMLELQPTPVNMYATNKMFNINALYADYVIPDEYITKIKNHTYQLGFQFFIQGDEKPRVMTFGKHENEEIRIITNLKFEDFDAVKNGKIKAK